MTRTLTTDSHDVDGALIAPLPRISIQAFCATAEIAETVKSAAADRRVEKAHVKVHTGGVAAAIEIYRTAPTPNVILVELTGTREEIVADLERLAEVCEASTKVFVVGHVNDVLLYRDLMRRGVQEYLVAPVAPLDLVRTWSELYRAPDASPVGKTLAFVGAKGGVGASTVSHNVAWAIARGLQLETVVVDLDLAFGTAGLDFNQDPPQGIAEAVFAPDRLDSALIERLLAKCADNLSLLAAPATLDRAYDFAAEAFDPIYDLLRANVPFVVLDVPHLWTSWSRRAVLAADEIVIVATPDLANLRNAKNLVDLARAQRPHDAPPRLVLNMAAVPKRPEIKVAEFSRALDVEPIAIIPFEPQLFGTAANNGQMIAEISATHKVNDLFLEIARSVTGRQEARVHKRTLLDPLMARLLKRA
ncbi:AAA family ATPase [Terrihabitans rhizophilus]|uniref:AAA family ATPase n=1 Tax=Terrihabitans rhizophilus TaxID=3092662 RepID=A0ABU4RI57_9HYPH|nr:AAA family ATPase [Terrihabitans sp. PJ23]MDX6804507.1 AAA family ATPase [Terrihabitans sp. PJ23]